MEKWGLFVKLYICIICIKVLLLPTYHSTDFEVHRNWLAITHSLPISEWYVANHSEWTLDYPPLFAWMEKALSYPARLFDPKMLEVESLNYCSFMTKVFQRFSVILTDLVLLYSVYKFIYKWEDESIPHLFERQLFLFVFILANFGLFVIDHIHFQYNGILFGILFYSFFSIQEGRIIEGTFWFGILICMKHIFLYISPVYVLYILKINIQDHGVHKSKFFLQLISIVILVFSFVFGPFIYMGQFGQLMKRLFPFKRGLCHAYWAPNFWPLYNVADKIIFHIGKSFNIINKPDNIATMTGGLVQNYEHLMLPNILPIHTFILVLLFMIPSLIYMWFYKGKNKLMFLRCVVSCALSSFMFGWHVHEKAILIIILPFTLMSMKSPKLFFILSSVGHYSLFPLIFSPQETIIIYCLYIFITIFTYFSLQNCCSNGKESQFSLSKFEFALLAPIFFIELYKQILHERILPTYQFLPLMLTSVYCSIIIIYVWMMIQVDYVIILLKHFKKKNK